MESDCKNAKRLQDCENFAEKHDSKFLSHKKGTTPGVYVFLLFVGKSNSIFYFLIPLEESPFSLAPPTGGTVGGAPLKR